MHQSSREDARDLAERRFVDPFEQLDRFEVLEELRGLAGTEDDLHKSARTCLMTCRRDVRLLGRPRQREDSGRRIQAIGDDLEPVDLLELRPTLRCLQLARSTRQHLLRIESRACRHAVLISTC